MANGSELRGALSIPTWLTGDNEGSSDCPSVISTSLLTTYAPHRALLTSWVALFSESLFLREPDGEHRTAGLPTRLPTMSTLRTAVYCFQYSPPHQHRTLMFAFLFLLAPIHSQIHCLSKQILVLVCNGRVTESAGALMMASMCRKLKALLTPSLHLALLCGTSKCRMTEVQAAPDAVWLEWGWLIDRRGKGNTRQWRVLHTKT